MNLPLRALLSQNTEEKQAVIKFARPLPLPKGLVLLNRNSEGISSYAFRLPIADETRTGKDGSPKTKKLGSGAISKVYEGFFVESEGTFYKTSRVAIAKLPIKKWTPIPFDLLKEVPPSPYLLARPMHTYFPKDSLINPNIYIVMPLIKEKKTTRELWNEAKTALEGFELLLESTKNTAKAGAILAHHDLVHGDITLSNMALGGLFDWGTLRKKGESRIGGAPLAFSAPELVYYRAQHEPTKRRPDLIHRVETFEKWYGKDATDQIKKETPPLKYDSEGALLFSYTTAIDVFLLGMQWVSCYGHPSTWLIEDERKAAVSAFILNMIHWNPEARPSMGEAALFFEKILS